MARAVQELACVFTCWEELAHIGSFLDPKPTTQANAPMISSQRVRQSMCPSPGTNVASQSGSTAAR